MKQRVRNIIFPLLGALALGFMACPTEPETIAVTGVSLNKTTLSLTVGDTATLVATVAPKDADNKTVAWTSSDKAKATVSDTGVVTAVAAGTATITATTADGGKTASCVVTVTASDGAVTGVSLNTSTLSLTVSGTATLVATVTPVNATNKIVTWTSSDTAKATVSDTGVVTAVATGTATITATTADGGKTASCVVTVTVADDDAVTGVSLDRTVLSLTVGGTTTLVVTVTPANATNKIVTWTSSDTTKATVSEAGLVTAVATGTATITAMTADGGKTASCVVTVTAGDGVVTGVSLDRAALSLIVGGTTTLTATVAPANATNKAVTWTSSDTTKATVSEAGLVTAVAEGTATITATTADGGKTASCVVTVSSTSGSFATPAQYREMLLATPDSANSVTIIGDNAYYYNPSQEFKGVFIQDRTVNLSPFNIAKYETTYELWYEVKQWATDTTRGANMYTFANAGREGNDGTNGAAPTSAAKLEPVTNINWRDVIVWCNAYSEMSGKEPVYYTNGTYSTVLRASTNAIPPTEADLAVIKPGANGYRLPTEAEWEYAARGGGTPSIVGSFVDKWAGTNSALGDYAWYGGNSGSATHAVGGKTANGLGLYDMSGNVFEWCWDWYDSIGAGAMTNPVGPGAGTLRVVRGGGWYYTELSFCAVACRGFMGPDIEYLDIGFRVVCP